MHHVSSGIFARLQFYEVLRIIKHGENLYIICTGGMTIGSKQLPSVPPTTSPDMSKLCSSFCGKCILTRENEPRHFVCTTKRACLLRDNLGKT